MYAFYCVHYRWDNNTIVYIIFSTNTDLSINNKKCICYMHRLLQHSLWWWAVPRHLVWHKLTWSWSQSSQLNHAEPQSQPQPQNKWCILAHNLSPCEWDFILKNEQVQPLNLVMLQNGVSNPWNSATPGLQSKTLMWTITHHLSAKTCSVFPLRCPCSKCKVSGVKDDLKLLLLLNACLWEKKNPFQMLCNEWHDYCIEYTTQLCFIVNILTFILIFQGWLSLSLTIE